MRVKLCWDSQYSLGIRPHETPTGRQHAAGLEPTLKIGRLFSLFSVILASLGGFLGPLGPFLGLLGLNFTIFIDF